MISHFTKPLESNPQRPRWLTQFLTQWRLWKARTEAPIQKLLTSTHCFSGLEGKKKRLVGVAKMPLTYCRWTAHCRLPSAENYRNALTRSRKKGAPFLKAEGGGEGVSQNWQVGVGKGVMRFRSPTTIRWQYFPRTPFLPLWTFPPEPHLVGFSLVTKVSPQQNHN